ncbi:DUF3488 and transglutaminase-like domain-containing protein [Agromyces mediolanus]|uniref:transglutaminase family protein n=1 Tax=Agromyces mediolanus TaxID=41986 RepID=UPI00203D4002|nr:DUF3488 and transglutaminase-like domain-containing protein [Agromyces mediolanus]MCM3657178.1 DUF3488 and transglutaminase-like domain-containing protein [Agromyces mediolanus]
MRRDRAPLSRLQALALSGATFLLLVIAVMALGPLLAGSGWWWLCTAVAAAVLFGGAGLRAIRLPASLVPLGELLILLATLTLFFGGSSSLLLLVPTADTFGVFGELLGGAQRTIQQQSVPAVVVPSLAFGLALGTGLLAVLADLLVLTFRLPALAAAPALVPILVPGFLIEDGAEVGTLVLTAAAFLLLLRVDVRVRRRAALAHHDDEVLITAPRRTPVASSVLPTIGLAAAGLVAASLLTASTPSVSTSLLLGSGGQGALFARGVSPFLDLGRDLRRPDAVPAFSYVARDGDRPYFRLLTIDRFDGEVWAPSDRRIDGDNAVDEFPTPTGLGDAVARTQHPIDITVQQLRTTWLPLPYPVSSVEGLDGSWFWDRGPLTVRSADSDTSGQQYRATMLEIDPTAEQLRAAGSRIPESIQEFTELPEETPAPIAELAAELGASADTAYDRAVAIQEYLRGPDFRYSVEAPVEESYDGGGLDVVAEFLKQREGYCVQFASTMAVLARELGIPSRISVGYTAGTPTTTRVENVAVVQVDSQDLHAWPELYFQGVGWVPFEPTPGRGTVPDYSRPGASETAPVPERAPGTPPPTPGARPDLDPERQLASGGSAGATSDPVVWPLVTLGLVVVLLLPAGVRSWVRRVRFRRVRRDDRGADAAWREAMGTASDLGSAAGTAALTPREAADVLLDELGGLDDAGRRALYALRDAVERARYGPPGTEAPVSEAALVELVTALRRRATPVTRVRARLLPVSLLDTARAGRRSAARA